MQAIAHETSTEQNETALQLASRMRFDSELASANRIRVPKEIGTRDNHEEPKPCPRP
jgi:hypothetical protein